MDPREFHALAVRLAAATGAAEIRSATSRAYYAAFLVADQFLRGLGFHPARNENRHGLVENLLSYSADAPLRQASSQLSALRGQRNRADYDLADSALELKTVAQSAVSIAAEVIRALDGCGPGARRTAVQVAIASTLKRLSSSGGGPP